MLLQNSKNLIPRLLLVTNIPSHHQMPLAQALYNLLHDSFRVAFLSPVSGERITIGWNDAGVDTPWVLRVWESTQSANEFMNWMNEADVVVNGFWDYGMLRRRLTQGKLCMMESERIWKPSNPLWGLPPRKMNSDSLPINFIRCYYHKIRTILKNHAVNSKHCHYLAIGAYAARDQSRIGMFNRRMWTFGYFVPVPKNAPTPRDPSCMRILWAGRMINLKSVDVLLKAIRSITTGKRSVLVTLIGDGPELPRLKNLVVELDINDKVRFLPVMDPMGVRSEMQRSDVYVLPSTYEEGWGAVLNEAMSEGCVVIASEGVGAAPVLIHHGWNGFIFPVGDPVALAKHLEWAMLNPSEASAMGFRAWEYVRNFWSPETAASRLIALIDGLLGKTSMPFFTDGPCSPAKIMRPARGN